MFDRKKLFSAGLLLALMGMAPALVTVSRAAGAAREEGRLLVATEVLQEIQAMPDQRIPDTLLSRAYGIAVIPDVTKVAFMFGGRHGNGVLSVRDTLSSPWSNPVFVALTGGSWGIQAGAQSSDIILVFTTKGGVEGMAGGKITLGADASVATGPVGRQGSAGTDMSFNSEVYSYARTRGLFGGIALDGSVIAIDRVRQFRLLWKERRYRNRNLSPARPRPRRRRHNASWRVWRRPPAPSVSSSPAPQAESPAAAVPATPEPGAAAPNADGARTYPLEDQKQNPSGQ